MKIAIEIILSIVCLLYIGHTTITIHPFSINVEHWHRPVALILICAGVALLTTGEYAKGRIEGQNEAFDKCVELLKKKHMEEKK